MGGFKPTHIILYERNDKNGKTANDSCERR